MRRGILTAACGSCIDHVGGDRHAPAAADRQSVVDPHRKVDRKENRPAKPSDYADFIKSTARALKGQQVIATTTTFMKRRT